LQLPNFYVLPAFSSQLSVFSNLCIMNTLLLYQLYRSLRNVSFGGCILGFINSAYHGWLSMMTSSDIPFLVLPWAPLTPNPPLRIQVFCKKTYYCDACLKSRVLHVGVKTLPNTIHNVHRLLFRTSFSYLRNSVCPMIVT